MRKLKFLFCVFIFVFGLSLVAEAATYGYVSIEGKKLKTLRREATAVEALIKEWPNGEVIFRNEESSGFIFKKHKIMLFFAGNSKEIRKFLSTGPYPGDFLKNIAVRYCFARIPEGEPKAEKVLFHTRIYSNIRNAFEAHVGKSANDIAKSIKAVKNNYYTHVTVDFYNLQYQPENYLMRLKDGETKINRVDF